MSEETRPDPNATAKRLAAIVCKLKEPGLSLPELDSLQREKEALLAAILETISPYSPNDEESHTRTEAHKRFIERLVTRQGTVTPNFRELYRKRARFDNGLYPKKPRA
jgi:hypothetical protein